MRQVSLGNPTGPDDFERWVRECMKKIEEASRVGAEKTSDDFTVTGFTKTTDLDASAADATQVANVLATFIDALKRRGIKRK